MSTAAQIDANRQNAKSSTGPVTEQGKRKASQNSYKHGLTAAHLIQPGENRADYEALETTLIQEWNPANATEATLVQEIAQSYWKLQRVRKAESSFLEAVTTIEHRKFNTNRKDASALDENSAATFFIRALESQAQALAILSRYETKYERAWYRAINTLTKLQAERRKQEKANGFVPQNAAAHPDNGSVQQNNLEPVTLENAPPEIQKLILETASQLVRRFMEDNGFVPQNGAETESVANIANAA